MHCCRCVTQSVALHVLRREIVELQHILLLSRKSSRSCSPPTEACLCPRWSGELRMFLFAGRDGPIPFTSPIFQICFTRLAVWIGNYQGSVGHPQRVKSRSICYPMLTPSFGGVSVIFNAHVVANPRGDDTPFKCCAAVLTAHNQRFFLAVRSGKKTDMISSISNKKTLNLIALTKINRDKGACTTLGLFLSFPKEKFSPDHHS